MTDWGKRDLAFVHFGKAGGQYVAKYVHGLLGSECVTLNSFSKGMRRDWSKEEMRVIATRVFHGEGQHFVANHHLNFPPDLVQWFHLYGWETFCFLRDPRDVICSLYFYGLKLIKAGKDCAGAPLHPAGVLAGHLPKNSFEPLDATKLTLDEWVKGMVVRPEFHRFWVVPPYLEEVRFKAVLSDESLTRFFREHFGHEYEPRRRVNVSGNQGFERHVADGEISQEAREIVNGHPAIVETLKRLEGWQ